MKKLFLILALVFGTTLFANAKSPEIEGTWKIVSSQGRSIPDYYTQITLRTPTHFIWTLYDKQGNMLDGAGGTWKLEGNIYTETIEMVLPGMKNFYGEQFVQHITVEGDRMTKTFNVNGNDIVEVSERVK